MKRLWQATERKLAGYPAIHIDNTVSEGGDELCLAGLYGEVWANSGGSPDRSFKAWTDGTGLRRLRKAQPGMKLPEDRARDEECTFAFSKAELPTVLKAIGYSRRRPSQAKRANSRN